MKSKWKTVRFGDILEKPLRNGLTKPKSIRGAGVKLINMGELFANDRMSTKIHMDLAPVSERELSNTKVLKGDLLFARQSLVLEGAGKCSIIIDDCECATFESHLIRARIDQTLGVPDFYYYYFNSYYGKKKIESIVEQVAAAGIRGSDLVKLEVPLPSINEQKAIVSTLTALDDKIEYNKKINANLEAQVQASFKSWFVDFEPFHDGDFVESELGKIPKGWPIQKLIDNCAIITRGITPKYAEESDQVVINQKCIRNHEVNLFLARKHIPRAVTKKWLIPGDILINSTGQGTLGRTAQWFGTQDNVTVDSHVTIVRPIENDLSFYLGQMIMSREPEIESMASGSTGQTELSRERLGNLVVLLPEKAVLHSFAKIIEPLLKMRTHNINESSGLSQLRDTLLTKLMSGEIEVPVTH